MRICLILTCMRNIWKRDILACLGLIVGERNQKYLELKKREETMQGMIINIIPADASISISSFATLMRKTLLSRGRTSYLISQIKPLISKRIRMHWCGKV